MPNNHLSIRYNIEDGRDLNQLVGSTLDGGGIGAPSSGHNLFLRDQSLVGDVATTVKPDLVNTFLAQYARRHYNFPGVTGQPNLDIPNTLLFGHNFGVLDAIYESRFQATDSMAWVKGNHVAKFGVDLNFVNNFVIWPGFTPMRIVMPGLNCLVDFANFVDPLAGIPSNPSDGPCPHGDGSVLSHAAWRSVWSQQQRPASERGPHRVLGVPPWAPFRIPPAASFQLRRQSPPIGTTLICPAKP